MLFEHHFAPFKKDVSVTFKYTESCFVGVTASLLNVFCQKTAGTMLIVKGMYRCRYIIY